MFDLINYRGSWYQYLLWGFWNVLRCQRSHISRASGDEGWVCKAALFFQNYWSVDYCLSIRHMMHRGVLDTLGLFLFFWYFFGYNKSIAIFLFTLFGHQHKMPLINYLWRLFDLWWSSSWWCVLKFWFFDGILIFSPLWLVEIESQLVGDNSCSLGFKGMRARAWRN